MADGELGGELFDSIVLAEERFRGQGFQEGFKKGTQQGLRDGRKHGASHGACLSSERSFYYGFAVTWKCLLHHNPDVKLRKRVKALDALLVLVHTCPLHDPQSAQLQEHMEKLRAKFRQVCSMLGIPADFRDYVRTAEGTSF
ncbi:protein LTO1 homolog [Pholidichthys leucotaenia]